MLAKRTEEKKPYRPLPAKGIEEKRSLLAKRTEEKKTEVIASKGN